jgi:hypothetical protein
MRRILRSTTALVMAGALGLAGCTNPGGFSVAADDACRAERADLKAVEDYINRSAMQGAIGGALVGGLAGGLIGGDAKGALIGAAVGGVAGGLGGYFLAKQKATSSPAELNQAVYKDVSADNAQLDQTTRAFRNLRDCRFRTAATVKSDVAAGKISREDGLKQLATIRTLFDQDVNYAQQLGAKMDQRGQEYGFASDKILDADPQAKQAAAARRQSAAAPAQPSFIAKEAARVREQPSATGRQIASLSPGEQVGLVEPANGAEWTHVQLPDGRSGYVASRLIGPPGTAVATAAPRPAAAAPSAPAGSATGVAEVTESNQLKRKALGDDIAQAKAQSGPAFDLDAKISVLPALSG